ncbi:MAG: glucose-6-phosphate dehydrogenase, partial [Candidatus Brocadia sp. WS118]
MERTNEMIAVNEPLGKTGNPCVMVIFGASGDLAKRKLIPALYNLARERLLSREFAIVGFSRTKMSHEEFRERISKDMKEHATGAIDPDLWNWFVQRLYYSPGDIQDPNDYQQLKDLLLKVDNEQGTRGNYLYYLATSPELFSPIIQHIGAAGLALEENGCWRRVIIEKPFGRDIESARALNQEIRKVLSESQIYRIDHYLGKETVQNIMVFRFANGIFEPIWNRRYIDHVQITVAEDIGVGQRGDYYDSAGALRDMVPNHMFQLLTLTAMEPPISFEADAVRDEQVKILHAIQSITPEGVLRCTVRGQ